MLAAESTSTRLAVTGTGAVVGPGAGEDTLAAATGVGLRLGPPDGAGVGLAGVPGVTAAVDVVGAGLEVIATVGLAARAGVGVLGGG
jgi:hypothetical protein